VRLRFTPAPGIEGVTAYEIERDGVEGRETVPAGADYTFTASELSGPSLHIRSLSDNGFVSAPARWFALFESGPGVVSEIYDESSPFPGGGEGVAGTFTFSPPPGWSEVASYRYDFDGLDPGEAPAGPDGRASITWTPSHSGYFTLTVTAVRADGTAGDSRWYSFEVG
jgi:hypothetical protein